MACAMMGDSEICPLTASEEQRGLPFCANEEDVDEQIPSSVRSGRRAALAGAALVLCGLVALVARLGGSTAPVKAVRGGEVVELVGNGSVGEDAGPDLTPQEMLLGSYPKFGNDVAARQGSPPVPTTPNPSGICQACESTGGMCCGSSCCAKESVCCKESIGLCCSAASMCCHGTMCCQPGFNCGRTRNFAGDLKYNVLEMCGPGPTFRRLAAVADEEEYKAGLRRLLANATALQAMLQ